MGRPIKEGFDYFPLNTDFFKDRHVRRLLRKYKSDGIIVLIYLWCECYGDKGYYMNLDDSLVEDVSDDLLISSEKVGEIIEYLFEQKWFRRLVSGNGDDVITSSGVQKRYLSIRSQFRRKVTDPDPSIWLIGDDDESISSEELHNNSEEIRNNSVNLRINSREQKRTEQNRREVNKREQKKTEGAASDSSDSFQSSFSDFLITRLEGAGVDIKQNTLRLINRWITYYDRKSIDEAVDLAIEKDARNIVGYVDTVLRKWSVGEGCPKWVEAEEQRLQKEKEEHMKPGALGKILVNGHEALGT